MGIVNLPVAQREYTMLGIDDGVTVHFARFDRRRHRERFQSRAGLEQIGNGAVAHRFAAGVIAVVRVVAGIVGESQHFAAARIENHYRTGLGSMLLDRTLQLAIGDVLQIAIQTEHDIAARLGRVETTGIFNNVPVVILDDALTAGFSGKLFLQEQLQTLLPNVVLSGKSQRLRSLLTRRIIAAIFALQRNPRQIQTHHFLDLIGGQQSFEIDKVARSIEQTIFHFLYVHAEYLRQFFYLSPIGFHVRRARPHRFNRGTDGKWFAVAVGDHAAVRTYFDHAAVALVAFFLQEIIVYPLQIHATPKQPGQSGQQCYKSVSYTHLRAHETRHDLVCRLLLEKKKTT